jgi:hypothetical protein
MLVLPRVRIRTVAYTGSESTAGTQERIEGSLDFEMELSEVLG